VPHLATVLLLYAAAPRVFTEPDALTRRAFDLGGEVGQSDLRRCNRTLPAQRHAIDQQ